MSAAPSAIAGTFSSLAPEQMRIRGRNGELSAVESDYQPARFSVGQRSEQDGVYYAENSGVGADPQGQDHDGKRR